MSMLINFSVGNFKSFKDIVSLGLEASSDTSLPENTFLNDKFTLLKSLVVYGANASGKSNLFKAFSFVQHFIFDSAKGLPETGRILVEPFQLDETSASKPSYFEITFLQNDIKYRYGFEVDQNKVQSEWLFFTPKTKEVELFTRENKEISFHPTEFKEASGLKEKTRDNALFLSVVAQFNGKVATEVVSWFHNHLNIISGLEDQSYLNFSLNKLKDPTVKEKVLEFLRVADLSIEDYEITPLEVNNVMLPPVFTEEVRNQLVHQMKANTVKIGTKHKKFDNTGDLASTVEFDLFTQESEGTKKLLFLSVLLLDTIENGKVLLIDELDSRLHPLILEYIVKLFNTSRLNPSKHAQLIFATHNTLLLSKKYFRRDQIWFAEKNKFGASELFSLQDVKLETGSVRKDNSFEKNYILGKFGAVPYIDDTKLPLEEVK